MKIIKLYSCLLLSALTLSFNVCRGVEGKKLRTLAYLKADIWKVKISVNATGPEVNALRMAFDGGGQFITAQYDSKSFIRKCKKILKEAFPIGLNKTFKIKLQPYCCMFKFGTKEDLDRLDWENKTIQAPNLIKDFKRLRKLNLLKIFLFGQRSRAEAYGYKGCCTQAEKDLWDLLQRMRVPEKNKKKAKKRDKKN